MTDQRPLDALKRNVPRYGLGRHRVPGLAVKADALVEAGKEEESLLKVGRVQLPL